MRYYYCQSKFEHAVIEAHNSADAKEKYIGIINAQLEDYAKLTVKDVDSCVVNAYFSEAHEDREIANLRVKMGTQVAMRVYFEKWYEKEKARANGLEAMVDRMSSIIADCAMLVGAMRELCYEIEKCGASEQLTNTVILASEITNELKYITGGVAVEDEPPSH